jgi:hypothetical protein
LALYETPLKLLGGYYAVGAAIPYVWMKVKGEIQATGQKGGRPAPCWLSAQNLRRTVVKHNDIFVLHD